MKRRYRILFFFIGLAGIVILALNANPDELDWERLFKPSFFLLMAGFLCLWAIIYSLHTWVYRLIMGDAAKEIPKYELYRICIAGFALNNVTPAGLVGGEPFRILELKKYMSTEKATSSTVTFSLIYIMGHVMLWLTSVIIYFLYGCPASTFMTVMLSIAAIVLAAACIVFLNHHNKGLVRPALGIASSLPLIGKKVKALIEKKNDAITEIDDCYIEFRSKKDVFTKALLLEYASRILEGAEYFVIFLYLGNNVHITGGILILGLASLVGNLLFMVPMQAGTREGGMIIALEMLNISVEAGVMGGLIYRIRDLLCTMIGIICILPDKKDLNS